MNRTLKASVLGLAGLGLLTSTALAELSGDLRIISDMSNPAPRAVMESLAAEFGAMHPISTSSWKSSTAKPGKPRFATRCRPTRPMS
jgi:hypothetical protein